MGVEDKNLETWVPSNEPQKKERKPVETADSIVAKSPVGAILLRLNDQLIGLKANMLPGVGEIFGRVRSKLDSRGAILTERRKKIEQERFLAGAANLIAAGMEAAQQGFGQDEEGFKRIEQPAGRVTVMIKTKGSDLKATIEGYDQQLKIYSLSQTTSETLKALWDKIKQPQRERLARSFYEQVGPDMDRLEDLQQEILDAGKSVIGADNAREALKRTERLHLAKVRMEAAELEIARKVDRTLKGLGGHPNVENEVKGIHKSAGQAVSSGGERLLTYSFVTANVPEGTQAAEAETAGLIINAGVRMSSVSAAETRGHAAQKAMASRDPLMSKLVWRRSGAHRPSLQESLGCRIVLTEQENGMVIETISPLGDVLNSTRPFDSLVMANTRSTTLLNGIKGLKSDETTEILTAVEALHHNEQDKRTIVRLMGSRIASVKWGERVFVATASTLIVAESAVLAGVLKLVLDVPLENFAAWIDKINSASAAELQSFKAALEGSSLPSQAGDASRQALDGINRDSPAIIETAANKLELLRNNILRYKELLKLVQRQGDVPMLREQLNMSKAFVTGIEVLTLIAALVVRTLKFKK